MPFVYEKITNDELFVLRNRISPPTVLSFSAIKVVDDDRDAVFVCLGGKGYLPEESAEPLDHFAMLWDTHRVLFHGRETLVRHGQFMVKVLSIQSLVVPTALKDKVHELKQMIKEAYGRLHTGIAGYEVSVDVQFPAPTFY